MRTCNICLEDIHGGGAVFKARPASCLCHFYAHQVCFDAWLQNNDVAYKCLICRVEVRVYKPDVWAVLTALTECYGLYVYIKNGPPLIARVGYGIFYVLMYLVFAYSVLEKLRRIVVRCQRLRG